MNMKKILLFIAIMVISSIFVGCSAEYDMGEYLEGNQEVYSLSQSNISERLIIYNVDITFDVKDLEEASAFLVSLLETDEWFDQESKMSRRYSYVIRVKTDRLDDFITDLKDE